MVDIYVLNGFSVYFVSFPKLAPPEVPRGLVCHVDCGAPLPTSVPGTPQENKKFLSGWVRRAGSHLLFKHLLLLDLAPRCINGARIPMWASLLLLIWTLIIFMFQYEFYINDNDGSSPCSTWPYKAPDEDEDTELQDGMYCHPNFSDIKPRLSRRDVV